MIVLQGILAATVTFGLFCLLGKVIEYGVREELIQKNGRGRDEK